MPTLKKQTETQLVKACLQWLALRGILAWQQNTGAMALSYKGKRRFVRFGTPGMPDIVGILPERTFELGGRFLAVECKMPGRKPTNEQRAFLGTVTDMGGLALVVHSLDELQRGVDGG